MKKLRLVFAGTPEFTLPCLNALEKSSHPLIAVYTQPDRPAGRGRKLQASVVKDWALRRGLPVYQPLNFKTESSLEELAALKPDLLVVIAYGLILPPSVLTLPSLGCINVHASLLPRWRGASPIQQAILAGDHVTGVTVMQMDAGMDTGDKLIEASCAVDSNETASSLHDKLADLAVQPLLQTIDALAKGEAQPKAQDSSLATYAAKIKKEAAFINWQQTAIEIDRLIRAFNPWPIAYTKMGEELVRIHSAEIVLKSFNLAPGTIVELNKQGMTVAAGEQAIRVKTIQFPGAKPLTIADWLNSNRRQLQENMVLE